MVKPNGDFCKLYPFDEGDIFEIKDVIDGSEVEDGYFIYSFIVNGRGGGVMDTEFIDNNFSPVEEVDEFDWRNW